VIVDAGSDEMAVWIVNAREQLKQRKRSWYGPQECLPIFDGLMAKGDSEAYDIACILPSIRCLASKKYGQYVLPSYKAACELLRKTRNIADPVEVILTQKEVEEAFSNTQSKTDILAPLKGAWASISKIWRYLASGAV
jgi:hypothetical protein